MNDLLRRAMEQLEGEFYCALRPDHPLLINGPDALVGKGHSLVALFVPTKAEAQQPTSLLARLALTRYALPGHARCMLALEDSSKSDNYLVQRNFHESARLNDTQTISSFAADARANPTRVPFIDPQNRKAFMARYIAAYSRGADLWGQPETSSPRRTGVRAAFQDYLPAHLASWTEKRPSKSRTVFTHRQSRSLAALLPSGTRRSDILRRIIEHGLRERYLLDAGVLYPQDDTVPFLIVERNAPQTGCDPFKPSRAMAFAGWCSITEASLPRIARESDLLRNVQRSIARRLPRHLGRQNEVANDWEDDDE